MLILYVRNLVIHGLGEYDAMVPDYGIVTVSGPVLIAIIAVVATVVLAAFAAVWALIRATYSIAHQNGMIITKLDMHRDETLRSSAGLKDWMQKLEDTMQRHIEKGVSRGTGD